MNIDRGRIMNDFIEPNKKQYAIPVYQRNYEWSKEQCVKLFNDIVYSCKKDVPHFCGSIVYKLLKEVHNISYYVIIDGQQRITTIMLLLSAIRDVFKDDNITETYLVNNRGNEKNRIKLKQIESDRTTYEAIVNGNFDEKTDSNLGRNYKLFKKLIKDSKVLHFYFKKIM